VKEAAVSISTKTAAAEAIKASTGMSYLPFIIVGGIALFALTAITAVLWLKRKRT
jgi:LPXTG-motif cell wall-anchored protein